MRHFLSILKRELVGYFATPVAYVFIIFFLLLASIFTFQLSSPPFYERGQADLVQFFAWHPWLYLFLIPAISMRLWAEERKTGTIELLVTLPVTMPQIVLGKYIAAWIFAGISLALTFPVWITVNYLGEPDNGTIVTSYLGSFVMAGSFLAIGAAVSAMTKNQVIAFIVSVVVCFSLLIIGHPPFVEAYAAVVPPAAVELISSFSFQAHYSSITKGLIKLNDVVYFATLIAFFLFANGLILDYKKAD